MFSSLEADNALDAVMESGSQSADPDSGSGTSTSVLERPEVDEDARLDDGGNADRFAHYVSKDRIEESAYLSSLYCVLALLLSLTIKVTLFFNIFLF